MRMSTARPAFATAPVVNKRRRPADASQMESPNDEKKSINFPIVKGMLMDTEDETKSSPMAMRRGFRSGFARDTIFRNDDADWGDFLKSESIDGFSSEAGFGARVFSFLRGALA
ncbi:hypothetical protein H0H87_004161 [Tephrocybe sp. NHM501043]|nr:hypothetical protein H0H87_004161 [Tephrocybe sp. NHM501043]